MTTHGILACTTMPASDKTKAAATSDLLENRVEFARIPVLRGSQEIPPRVENDDYVIQ